MGFDLGWVNKYLGRPPRTFVEVGCYDAGIAIGVKSAYPDCRAIAFEACPDMYAWLLDQKKDKTVEIFHYAVCDAVGSSPFMSSWSVNGEVASGSIFPPTARQATDNPQLVYKEARQVPAITLSEFCAAQGIDRVDIVHMVIQGAEGHALKGFGEIRPKMLHIGICEAPHHDGAIGQEELKEMLMDMGYEQKATDGYTGLYVHQDPLPSEVPLLSILIPSIPSRADKLKVLVGKLESQAAGRSVEILTFSDNKRRSIGLKRDALVQIARGEMLAFCDDDDDVAENYVSEIVDAIKAHRGVDVISFNQIATINSGNPFKVSFGIQFENQVAKQNKNGVWVDILRRPFHVCAWRAELAKTVHFPDVSYSEDFEFCSQLWPKVRSQHRIDKVLHYYYYRDDTTEARTERLSE